MTDSKDYPGLHKALQLIALDNGGINWTRSEKKQHREAAKFLSKRPAEMLEPIERWLATLSHDDFETVCMGENSEGQAILKSAPPFTDDLLNDYFDEVC